MTDTLAEPVDVQVAIAASHPIMKSKAKLRPNGLYCYADAVRRPEVYRADGGGEIDAPVQPDHKRVGGSFLGKKEAKDRAKRIRAVAPHEGAAGNAGADTVTETATKLRGRIRYYALDYTKD